MLIDTKLQEDGLAILRLSGPLTRANALHSLIDACDRLIAQGRKAIALDLSGLKRINMAGLAALVELAALRSELKISYCGLSGRAMQKLTSSGLDRGLRLFDKVEDVVATPEFRAHSLTNTKAVVLCAGRGSRVAPLSDVVPKPMLDIVGKPVLHWIIEHLKRFGIRDILLNPGHLGPQIIDYFQHRPISGPSIFFSNEGYQTAKAWYAEPLGSATTLKRLQTRHNAFAGDFLVLCGDALIDLDVADMMQAHRQSGADVTIAAQKVAVDEVHKYGIMEATPGGRIRSFVEKPQPGTTNSQLANTGIYIFSPRVLDLISDHEGLDIACDLLPAVMQAGYPMQVYDTTFSWTDIGCGRDYADALQNVLEGRVPGIGPTVDEIRPQVWCANSAYIASGASIEGPCYVGPGARVEAQARLKGFSMVGDGSVVRRASYLENSIVMPSTAVNSGVWAQNTVLHANWAFDHRLAGAAIKNPAPIPNVGVAEVSQVQKIRNSA